MAATERTSSETIYQACIDLRNAGRMINRSVLVKVTNLKMKIVDDHVDRMVENDKLRRIGSGVIEVVEQFPPNRRIQKTVMQDGTIEIALGGEVLEMTPSEASVIGQMLIGEATMFAQLRGDRDVQDQVARLQREAAEGKKRMAEMTAEIVRMRRQRELAFD
jgi:hypothetical protein